MADDTPDVNVIDADAPEERTEGLARFYGTTPTTYEEISEQSRDHTRSAPVDANAQGWMPLGPRNVGGAVRCIAQNPRRPTELIAGSAQGGIWKTTDDGYSWRQVATDNVLGAVCSIAYASGDTRIIYAGTGELSYRYPSGVGFLRSKDGGETFERLVDGLLTAAGSAGHYARIVVDPADDEQAWIASDRGLWRLNGTSFTLEAITGLAANASVTDVAVAPDPANANQYLILVGVSNVGVASGVFNRGSKNTTWTVVGPAAPAPWTAGVNVVRVAWAGPPNAYALVGVPVAPAPNARPNLFRTANSGAAWASAVGAVVAENQSAIAWYALALAVNPQNPGHVLAGCVNVNSTTTNGVTWTTALDWTLFDSAGQRAQHADQGAIVFDVRGKNAVWVANDGGISFSADSALLPPVWRKRSFGITATQLFDITTHPRFPSICGGGMQDNGTFVSYGGPTWYRLAGGDGGALAFHPTSPFRFYTSNQVGIDRVDVSQFPPPPPAVAGAPPRNSSTLPDVRPPSNVHAPFAFRLQGLAPPGSFFMRALEGNGFVADFVLLGAANAAQYATEGVTLVNANLPGLVGNITALALPPNGTDMYAGSDRGELYFNTAALPASNSGAAQPAWNARRRMPGPITAIAIHPANVAIIAVATALGGGNPGVFLSHDRGAHWVTITGAPNALPSSPFLSLAFDPLNQQTLFVGTLSGVYVARDLPAFPLAAPADVVVPALPAVAPPPPASAAPPTWQSYVRGLPFVPITDLSVNLVTQTLRCATFGRGAFEANITGATPPQFALPSVGLLIRNNAVDDGRPYVAPNVLGGDTRVGTAAPPPTPPAPIPPATPDVGGAIDVSHSIDIRVDSPHFQRLEPFAFGEQIDGAEFDETLVSDEPLVGEENIVYVQVQNRGADVANNVDIHLYFADAGNPPVPPAIPADIGFPNAPPAASLWQRCDVVTVGAMRPGEPAVATFRWTPPLTIRQNAALLAVATNGQDNLASLAPGLATDLARSERRAALFVTHVQRDTIIIRDGLDDIGDRGAVPWGGRSPDIIVRQVRVPAANFAVEFADLAASHAEDRAKTGQNFVYVRVSNRTETVVPQSTVRLFRIPRSAITAPGAGGTSWQSVAPAAGVVLNNIPAHGSLVAEFGFALPADPDPDASADGKGIILLAMANTADAAGTELDPFPDFSDIADVSSFWRFFTGAPLGNNAAMRALRFVP